MTYYATWPIGTVHYNQLPESVKEDLLPLIVDGCVVGLQLHRTATEGPYVAFSGYKIRVRIVETGPSTYVVQFV